MSFAISSQVFVGLLLCMVPAFAEAPGVRSSALPAPRGGAPGFVERKPATLGIDFTNSLRFERLSASQNLMNGTGVVAGDVDGDGRPDLFLVHREGGSALFRNLGEWRFTNITATAGVALTNLTSTGAAMGDLNGDGSLDLVVTSFGGPHAVLFNDGHGRFRDVTAESGLGSKTGSTSLAMADLDGDGDLDVYQCNFGTQSPLRDGAELSERLINGVPTVTGRWAKRVRIIDGQYYELGELDVLWWNDGHGHFKAANWAESFTDEDGRPWVEAPPDFGLAVQVRDIDGDGNPDIYVCNDFQTPDRLWLGDGRGHFKAAARHALRNMSYASMGVDFADIDRDGHLDWFTTEMLRRDPARHLRSFPAMAPRVRVPGLGADREDVPRNGLYHNRGDNTWEEIANFAGVAATDWSWAALFLDVDLDGWEDLLVSTGMRHDVNDRDVGAKMKSVRRSNMRGDRRLLAQYPPIAVPKAAFRNRRDLTFEEVTTDWGLGETRPAHGMATADFDGDGDLDLVMNCLDGSPLVYENRTTNARVSVRLRGAGGNTAAVGARIRLTGGPVRQEQEVIAGGIYLSGSDFERTFAPGRGPMVLEVVWRDGRVTRVEGVEANRVYEIDEAKAVKAAAPPKGGAVVTALFEDLSARLGLRHEEEYFDDFAIHPTLPHKLSQSGPGVALADVDGDGLTDVVVAGSRGRGLQIRRGAGAGGFHPVEMHEPLMDDAIGVLALPGNPGTAKVLVSLANFETSRTNGPSVLMRSGAGRGLVPTLGVESTGGAAVFAPAMAAADVDGDGRVEVFVGGSRGGGLWRWEGAQPERIRSMDAGGAGIPGLTSATWADLDSDGFPELVVAAEWSGIRILDGRTGQMKPVQLGAPVGWWRSVVAGDFDGDGRMDLAAGNWGLNSEWNVWTPGTPAVVHGDVDGDGRAEWLEARVDARGRWAPWRDRDTMATVLPGITARTDSHAAYAEQDARTWATGPTVSVRVGTLKSMVWLNRGDRFEGVPLPSEAQLAPVSGLVVSDFDGDGREDLFLAQNWFAVRPDDSRLDAGMGLMLRGDGRGGFQAMSVAASGIRVVGEQRGAATADLDADGRADLVVAQNGESVVYLRNASGRPGLRVRLAGPTGNPAGLGATVRLKCGTVWGPVRMVTGGGGYGSQDSPVLVMATPATPTAIEVRWPGGRVTSAEVSSDVREITVAGDGVMGR